MGNRAVVLGGGFNPPTRAHLLLMQSAMAAADAQRGIFVPTAHEYVLRKLKRQRCAQDTLSEEMRFRMLESFCACDRRLSVSGVRFLRQDCSFDFEMLTVLRTAMPDTEVFFVTGSDKLYTLPGWHRIDELIANFRILVARRGEDDLERIKQLRPFIAEHWDRFTVFDIPDEISAISSSAFRDRVRRQDESAREQVTTEIWDLLSENGKLPWNRIVDFHTPPHDFLSNFYEASVEFGGLVYGSNEAAFQAQKCLREEERRQFTEYGPARSKSVGRRVRLRADWETVKFGIMEQIVRAKFTQHPELAARLVATGDKILIEGNTWGDTCWGVDMRTGQGDNRLGRILMKVRNELKQQSLE